ncbi:GNAT family N-acetyltransferase [Pseudomonas sp. L5B5]|uniref:GNAT family N-acetyltransferase n=1 Tax=Pseudomonas sp. L5B5 TaxID=2883205 RepID=UPI001CF97BDE|nr:GNAT family N-acetyltransferase [Pseudomonas sp. L5B5]UCZ85297.1 GNAT family N-acetyltransferase [Pseudomonas sp. L5B5]
MLNTQRLVLRPWRASDATSLHEYASDPRVGPIAGWPVHTSEAQSLEIIQTVFSNPEVYAVTRRQDDIAIGLVGLLIGQDSHFDIAQDEAEIAYWIGVPFWGQGLIPEAVRELMRHAFVDLELGALWCGYFAGNEQSFRAQAKCGFKHHHTKASTLNPYMNDYRSEHISYISKQEWLMLQQPN